MIVVDLGCFPHHDHISIEGLARYRPDVLYEVDPWPALVEWHDEKMADDLAARRAELVSVLRCPVRPWDSPRTTLFSAIRVRWKNRQAAGAR
jgi:hypothetical protein